jgi:hypothetical protein
VRQVGGAFGLVHFGQPGSCRAVDLYRPCAGRGHLRKGCFVVAVSPIQSRFPTIASQAPQARVTLENQVPARILRGQQSVTAILGTRLAQTSVTSLARKTTARALRDPSARHLGYPASLLPAKGPPSIDQFRKFCRHKDLALLGRTAHQRPRDTRTGSARILAGQLFTDSCTVFGKCIKSSIITPCPRSFRLAHAPVAAGSRPGNTSEGKRRHHAA